MPSRRSLLTVLLGGLIAGGCDIIYAIVFYGLRGASAERVLQSVASGLLGAKAFEGGASTAALGLLLHFIIALLIAVIFYTASRGLPALARHPVIAGAAYGFAVFWVMNLVVLPLSAYPRKVTFVTNVVIGGLLVHMFLVGVPIALATRRALRAGARNPWTAGSAAAEK